MGEVDLHFRPSVPVFDAHMILGRPLLRPVPVETVEDTLAAMELAGIDRALVHSSHAIERSSREGNRMLLEMIDGQDRFVPQFVCSPAFDDLGAFADQVAQHNFRSVRMAPGLNGYQFRDWVVQPWLEWLAAERIPVWIDATHFDPVDMHDTMRNHPEVKVVLSEVHHGMVNWALPLLKSLPNLYIEISRFMIADTMNRLTNFVEEERILFGSRFPDSPIAPQLYLLHHSALSDATLRAICAGNLERLLGKG